MTTVPVLKCAGGRCETYGEIDLPDEVSPTGLKEIDVQDRVGSATTKVRLTPMYVGSPNGGRCVWAVNADTLPTRADWVRLRGYRDGNKFATRS